MPIQIPTYLYDVNNNAFRYLVPAIDLPPSLLSLRVSDRNSSLTSRQARRSNTAKHRSQKQKPLVSISIIAIKTGCIRCVESSANEQRPLGGEFIADASGDEAADRHQPVCKSVGGIAKEWLYKNVSAIPQLTCSDKVPILTEAFPPAPKLFNAVQIPGSQNATRPTITIWNRTERYTVPKRSGK